MKMGTQLCYDLIDSNKVVTITSLALSAVNQNWIHSESQTIHWWTWKH